MKFPFISSTFLSEEKEKEERGVYGSEVSSWGPPSAAASGTMSDLPFAPFSVTDRLGRAADWQSGGYGKFKDSSKGVAAIFNFHAAEDEESFHLVDSRPVNAQKKFGPRKFGHNSQHYRLSRRERELKEAEEAREKSAAGGQGKKGVKGRQQQQLKKKAQWEKNYWQGRDVPKVTYSASVDIRPEWTMVEQFTLTSLGKLNMKVGQPEEVVAFGNKLKLYDKSFDRVTPKTHVTLKKFNTPKVPNPTTSEDPIMQKLAAEAAAAAVDTDEDAGEGVGVTVFATDNIIATLMCAPRATYSWDILVTKKGGCIFLDKRESSNFDVLTVNETASQAPIEEDKDSINGVQHLGMEATQLNYNFMQQVTESTKGSHKIGEESSSWMNDEANGVNDHNPESQAINNTSKQTKDSSTEATSFPVGHRYRKWVLDNTMSVIVRCQIDAAMENKGNNILLSIKALNEFDSRVTGVDWRLKIENQRGAVLATELKNNNCKLAKWTAAALLGGVDQMKVGFVSRTHPRDNRNHQVIGVQFYRPHEFAMQINLTPGNMWAILKYLVEIVMKCEDGKYLFLKDPNKPMLRLYEISSETESFV